MFFECEYKLLLKILMAESSVVYSTHVFCREITLDQPGKYYIQTVRKTDERGVHQNESLSSMYKCHITKPN